jgi:hypothetical protein
MHIAVVIGRCRFQHDSDWGSFTKRWSAEMTKNMRYQFRFEGQSKPWIVDSQTGMK